MIAVNSDASFREDLGRAGIAYAGSLGEATQVVDARETMHAEMLALVLAMTVAHSANVKAVTFRHDADIVLQSSTARPHLEVLRQLIRCMLSEYPEWRLKHVPRGRNTRANVLARRALKMEIGFPVVKAHCESVLRRELERA
jgi:ribonuclease HI